MNLITIQNALILGYLFYGMTLIIHALVIGKIIPYQNVNGGRSPSYQAQKKVSIISIGIGLMGLIFIDLNLFFPGIIETFAYALISFVLTAYWMFGYVLQWLGTPFEKRYVSIVLILGILSHLMLGLYRFL